MIREFVTISLRDSSTFRARLQDMARASTIWGELTVATLLINWSMLLMLPDGLMKNVPSMAALPLIMPELAWAPVFAIVGWASLLCTIGGWCMPRRVCLFASTGLWSFLAWQSYLTTAFQTVGFTTFITIAFFCQAMFWQIRFRTPGR